MTKTCESACKLEMKFGIFWRKLRKVLKADGVSVFGKEKSVAQKLNGENTD